MSEQSVEQRLGRIKRGLKPRYSSDLRPTDDIEWLLDQLTKAQERERVLVEALRPLMDVYEAQGRTLADIAPKPVPIPLGWLARLARAVEQTAEVCVCGHIQMQHFYGDPRIGEPFSAFCTHCSCLQFALRKVGALEEL